MQKEMIVGFLVGVFSFTFFSCKVFAIFQQCSYKTKEFFLAISKGKNQEIKRLSTYSLIFIGCLMLLFIALKQNTVIWYSILAVVLCGVYYFKSKVVKPIVITKRLVRIYLVSAILTGGYFAFVISYFSKPHSSQLLPLIACGVTPALVPIYLCVAKVVNLPYDKLRYELSKSICRKRLRKNYKQIKIGITGSFAKTSVKNFLYQMLSTKYSVLATPKSYNTPLGICKTVKKDVEKYDVFIAEMGARYKNDIKELCKIVEPNVGLITGITCQHTQTLGTIEDVKRAKNQLIEGLPSGGFAVFSSQTSYSKQMYENATVEKYSVGKDNTDFVYYKNFSQEKDGIHFEIVIKGKAHKTFAPLLGEHNALNICIASATSLRLGVEIEKILSTIPMLKAVEHRAELITSPNGILVVDDSYNANLQGILSTASAISCLRGYKIAVTSGIVELGELSEKVNSEVGEVLAKHFNLVIGVGANSQAIGKGVCEKNVEFIGVDKTLDAKSIISQRARSGDVVAFFNDIPDRY